jgi:hypothetical protein
MNKHHLWNAGVGLLLALPATTGFSGYVITQTVETAGDGGGDKAQSKHVWSVDDGKFVLSISGGTGTTKYVFNGKTLYACGELDPKQTESLKKSLTAAGKKQLDSYKTGACQVVPSNFMARFFLSPMSSVESVDVTDGLRLTMAVQDYKIVPKDGKKKLLAHDCSGFQRSYTVVRTGDAGGKAPPPTVVSETFCQAPLSWRKSLWSEVAKSVLRQPKGRDLMQQLKKDQSQLGGFTLEAEGSQGVAANRTHFKLKTVSIVEAELSPKTFQTPFGFTIFSPENLELLAAANANAAKTPGAKKEEASVLDFMQSAVFCAIAGKLGCFSN